MNDLLQVEDHNGIYIYMERERERERERNPRIHDHNKSAKWHCGRHTL